MLGLWMGGFAFISSCTDQKMSLAITSDCTSCCVVSSQRIHFSSFGSSLGMGGWCRNLSLAAGPGSQHYRVTEVIEVLEFKIFRHLSLRLGIDSERKQISGCAVAYLGTGGHADPEGLPLFRPSGG